MPLLDEDVNGLRSLWPEANGEMRFEREVRPMPRACWKENAEAAMIDRDGRKKAYGPDACGCV